uniref:JmjC domain-containing protein n=1 Tax=Arcella intermedia TaxID=1963864 RepID=A0A6B2LGI2_9EUKA
MVTFKEFINTFIIQKQKQGSINNHILFDQIPPLKSDTITPFLCEVYPGGHYLTTCSINPSDMVTSLSKDYYHILFCNVVGYSYFRLYRPEETPRVYPYQDLFLKNISRISNIESPDENQFPLFVNADYVEGVLYPGDMLVIPSYTWFYRRSLSYSCSTSFLFANPNKKPNEVKKEK